MPISRLVEPNFILEEEEEIVEALCQKLVDAFDVINIGKLYPFKIFFSYGLSILLERKRFSSKNRFGKISFGILQFLSMTSVLLPVF